jgi:hypothetical protein
MSKKSKKQLNKEFLDKIKTITVGTGAKPTDTCPNCGETYSDHVLIGAVMMAPRKRKTKQHDDSGETSFAA